MPVEEMLRSTACCALALYDDSFTETYTQRSTRVQAMQRLDWHRVPISFVSQALTKLPTPEELSEIKAALSRATSSEGTMQEDAVLRLAPAEAYLHAISQFDDWEQNLRARMFLASFTQGVADLEVRRGMP
jgi:hypothetical protein